MTTHQSDFDDASKAHFLSISSVLTSARKRAQAVAGFPGDLPTTLAEAYEVQRLSRLEWPDQVAGWKIGGVPPAYLPHFDVDRLVGPIFERNVVRAEPGDVSPMPVFEGGFAAIEPEFIIQMGATKAQDRMFIGAEIASSPIPAINDVGPIAVICDFGNNHGMLLGQEIPDWQTCEPGTFAMKTVIDGEVIATKELTDFRASAMVAYQFLIDHAAANEIELPPGTFVSSGAITGVHEAPIGAKSRLDFGPFGTVDLELVKAAPFA